MGVVVLVFIAALALVAALARGPVSLTFFTPYIEQVLAAQYPDYELSFSNIGLEWNGRDKNLVVAVDNLEVSEENRRVASIPDVTVVFSGEALLRARIAPAELEFTGLRIRLNRDGNGVVKLGYDNAIMRDTPQTTPTPEAADTAEAAARNGFLEVLQELSREPDPERLTGYLERLEVYDSSVFIEDEILERFWRVTGADVFVWREEHGLRGQASGAIRIGNETVSLVALGDYDRELKRTEIDGQFSDLPLPLVGAQVPELEMLKGVDLNLTGHVNLELDETFRFETMGFDLRANDGRVDLPDLYHEPLPVESLFVAGEVTGDFSEVRLDTIEAKTLGATMEMTGTVEIAEVGTGLTLDGSLANLQVNDIGRFWPYSMASNGYDWVTANIREGVVPSGTYKINLPAGALESGDIPEGAVDLRFDLKGVTANYYAPLPKVTDITGSAVLTETGVTIKDMTGRLGTLEVTSDNVTIDEFDKYDQLADIQIHVTGNSREMFTFLDLEPLGLISPYGIVPSAMTGEGAVDASFKFPLRFDLTLEKVDYWAKGAFTDATIPKVAGDINLTGGDLKVAVDPKGVTVGGTAKLNVVPVTISAESWFSGPREGNRLYHVTGEIDEAGRASLDIASPYLTGPMAADIHLETTPEGAASGKVDIDFAKTEISLEPLHWTKEAGVPGRVTADLDVTAEDVAMLSNIVAEVGDMKATATAVLKDGLLSSLTVPKVTYGENDFALDFTQAAANQMNVRLHGAQFDLKPFVVATYDLNEADIDGPEDDRVIEVEVEVDRALMDDGLTLDMVRADMQIEGNLIIDGMATGKFAGEKSFNFEIARNGDTRTVSFVSDDAGSLFRGLDLYDDFRDGALKLTAEIDDTQESRPAKGTIEIKDVRVVNAPVLGKILTVGSLGGIVDLLRGDGIVFATVEGPFTYENGVFQTKDFRAVGSIGITFNGTVDQPANKIDAFGTVIPSYTLNSMLGNIPILGTLLVGRQGEGIFGFSYEVSGGMENPDIDVNAVSALAPGILRRMFFEPWDQDDIEPPSTNAPGARQNP
tara:strand:- start:38678 stop:41815 length:3138 start_codon:yes stop_codon:yes gene_type:complete